MQPPHSTTPDPALAPLPARRTAWVVYGAASLLLCASLLPLLSWVIFSADDSHLMRVATDYAPWLPFFVPDIYRELSVANFTPIPMVVYHTITMLQPFRPLVFLAFMLICLSMVMTLAAALVERLTGNRLAALATIVVIFSNLSVHTLVSRFYTMHYLFGAVFALLAVLSAWRLVELRNLSTSQKIESGTHYGLTVIVCVWLLLALLSKEVYLPLVAVVLLLAWYARNLTLAIGAVLVAAIYWVWRSQMLQTPVGIGEQGSYFAGVWQLGGEAWLNFTSWYIQTRWLILLGLLGALIVNPRLTARLLPLALIFGAPGLAVTHGIMEFGQHGDRIFFAMDCGLAIVAAVGMAGLPTAAATTPGTAESAMDAVAGSDSRQNAFPGAGMSRLQSALRNGVPARARPIALLAVVAMAYVLHSQGVDDYRAQTVASTDYRITRYLLDNPDEVAGKTVFVPLTFIQGDLMRVNNTVGRAPFTITQNCEQALSIPASQLIVFNDQGQQVSRNDLRSRCQSVDFMLHIVQAPRYNMGLLEWHVEPAPGLQAGVLFVDRAFAVPLPQFALQLVKLAPGERYQLFVTDGTNWWFSDSAPVEQISASGSR